MKKQLVKVMMLLILAGALVGCGLDADVSADLANSMKNATDADLSQLPFQCDGRVINKSQNNWQAQVMFKIEVNGNLFGGGGVMLIEAADALPKEAFRCDGVADVRSESTSVGGQTIERVEMDVAKLAIFADGFESGDLGFKTATISGTAFKGTDEELQ